MEIFKNLLIIYYIGINIVAFLAMGIDKQRSIKKQWRIPEKRLFLYVLLGGGQGGTMGMWLFRHKTLHWYFKYGFPAIWIGELVLFVWVYMLVVYAM